MKRYTARWSVILMALGLLSSVALAQPRNVILFIGDGMGPEQIKAGRLFTGAPLSFETFEYQGQVTTYSANAAVTDSAAAGTAIATGFKVNNSVISLANPGDGSELETILEYSQAQGKKVGLVTTTYMTHATPAAFGAHEALRASYSAIGTDYLTQTQPNLLFGGGLYMQNLNAESYGYSVIRSRVELEALETESADMISGQFGLTSDGVPYEAVGDFSSLPHLSEMTASALQILDNDPDGFFLMVEGGKIDWACHDNNTLNAVYEVAEFSAAVQQAIDWAQGRSDTLIIVTADHETGSMTVTGDNGAGNPPAVSWGSTGHSSRNVDIFAWGPNSEMVTGTLDNTEIIGIIKANPEMAQPLLPADGSAGEDVETLLAWSAGGTTASFDLYFGTDPAVVASADTSSSAFMGNLTTNRFEVSGLLPGTTYSWCIDTRNAAGELLAQGDVWSFTTVAELPLPSGSVWKFEDTGTDLGTLWKDPAYADAAWAAGPAQLGFGDGDENTVLTSGYPCYYFRRAFWAEDPAAIAALELQLLRDDGAIVYLNGVEILRSNMPEGPVSYGTYASVGIVDTGETVWNTYPIDSALLTSGKNVIAVEVHQANANSSDISFDLALLPAQPPVDDPPAAPANLSAVSGDAAITLDWDDNTESDLAGYTVYRATDPQHYSVIELLVTESAYADSGLENETTYYYTVTAVDLANQESSASAQVSAAPTAPSADAWVSQNPMITHGILGGDSIAALTAAGDGQVQTLSEDANGRAGASSLSADYQLTTAADRNEISSLELLVALSWTDSDANDALHVEILRSGTVWEDITAAARSGSWTAASPADYVNEAGQLYVRFSDSAAIRKEKKDILTLDMLYAKIEAGPIVPDTTPPVITTVRADTITYNSAGITWDTDEPADTRVDYGLSTALGTSVQEGPLGFNHSMDLTALQPETTYYFSVTSTDAAGNHTSSMIDSFTTLPEPELQTVHVDALTMDVALNRKKATATVTATIHDDAGQSVAGCTVSGDWYFKETLIVSGATGTTDSNGVATLVSPAKNSKSGDVFRFTVTTVTLPDGIYDATASVSETTGAVQ